MGLQQYSVGFMFDRHLNVPLIRKLKPAWQAQLLNGVGGKQEEGETLHQCMIREWVEETFTKSPVWDHYCSTRGTFSHCHYFRCFVDKLPDFPLTNDNGEHIEIWNAKRLPFSVVPNVPTMIGLALSRDFVLEAGLGVRAA
jgi:8-oxo-dGTP pyrophosphatase MutT (NUDIX family)